MSQTDKRDDESPAEDSAATPMPSPSEKEKNGIRKEAAPDKAAKRSLPPILDHFNARDLKTLIRCSIAFWVATILIFINPSLLEFGQATFFGAISLLFLPPSGIVLVYLMGVITLIMGMLLGWAWGVIAMKAALATRPAAETAAKLQQLGQTAAAQARATGETTAAAQQVLIYEGFMLDTRVTVTYFCMLCFFLYMMARLKVRAPKLTLTVIFAWIISDIFFTTGPLLPSFSGTIPSVLIKPAAAAAGIGVACSILIFPESTSHTVMFGMHRLVATMTSSPSLTSAYLRSTPGDSNVEQLEVLRRGLLGAWAGIEPSMGFLTFDFSVGLWNAQDVSSLHEPLRRTLMTVLSLTDFAVLQSRSQARAKRLLQGEADTSPDKDNLRQLDYGKHQIMESLNMVQSLHGAGSARSVRDSYEVLSETSAPLLECCRQALQAVADCIQNTNNRRWLKRLSKDQLSESSRLHSTALERLREERARFAPAATNALFGTHEHLFNADGRFKHSVQTSPQLAGLFIGLNFEDRLVRHAAALEILLEQTVLLERGRHTYRMWFPTNLRKFGAWAFGRSQTPTLRASSANDIPELDKGGLQEMQDKLHSPPPHVKKRNKFSTLVLGFGDWLSNEEGIFAFRAVIATLAIAVIAANTTTAGFFQREKGLWALIMAQTGLVSFMADFTYGVLSRLFGTLLGGVVGMLGWYIGSGDGPGNPYGLAAVTAVLAIVLMWLRLFAPPQFLQAVIMGGATVLLVIGYGYIDTHNPSYGNPGVGYTVFWRRTVMVLVGFTVGFIVSLIPWPSSRARNVSGTLATIVHAESDHYAVLLSTWQELGDDLRIIPAVEKTTIQLAETLSALAPSIGMLRFEFSSSAFDALTCGQIKQNCDLINESLARLHMRGSLLPTDMRMRFARTTGLLDHQTIGDVMAVLSIIEQALKTGDPLPARLPTPLANRCISFRRTEGLEDLSAELLRNEAYRGYCVALGAYLSFLSSIDELVLTLKGALGESHHVPENLTSLV